MTSLKILFVDDESTYVRPFLEFLRKAGHNPLHANGADEALGKLKLHDEIQTIVLDINMAVPKNVPPAVVKDGHTTGIWLLNRIAEEICAKPLPIYVLTNKSLKDVQNAVDHIANSHWRLDVLTIVQAKSTTLARLFPKQLEDHYSGAVDKWHKLSANPPREEGTAGDGI